MNEVYPPVPAHQKAAASEVEKLVARYSGCGAVYASTPYTSGRRFVEWRLGPGSRLIPGTDLYEKLLTEQVVRPNAEDARFAVVALRRWFECIIDPTDFQPDNGGTEWTQSDYRWMWGRVMEKVARAVVFLDGWYYSNGCSYEFARAIDLGLPMYTHDLGKLLSLAPLVGVEQLEKAIRDLRTRAAGVVSSSFLEAAVEDCRSLLRKMSASA